MSEQATTVNNKAFYIWKDFPANLINTPTDEKEGLTPEDEAGRRRLEGTIRSMFKFLNEVFNDFDNHMYDRGPLHELLPDHVDFSKPGFLRNVFGEHVGSRENTHEADLEGLTLFGNEIILGRVGDDKPQFTSLMIGGQDLTRYDVANYAIVRYLQSEFLSLRIPATSVIGIQLPDEFCEDNRKYSNEHFIDVCHAVIDYLQNSLGGFSYGPIAPGPGVSQAMMSALHKTKKLDWVKQGPIVGKGTGNGGVGYYESEFLELGKECLLSAAYSRDKEYPYLLSGQSLVAFEEEAMIGLPDISETGGEKEHRQRIHLTDVFQNVAKERWDATRNFIYGLAQKYKFHPVHAACALAVNKTFYK
jgi:hypothetical protein